MEFCSRCQKPVGIRKEMVGCVMDPETDSIDARWEYRCAICNGFIKASIEKGPEMGEIRVTSGKEQEGCEGEGKK